MSTAIKLVQGDTRPQLKFIITDDTTGSVVDISGSTSLLKFRKDGTSTLLFSRPGVLLNGFTNPDGTINLNAPYDVPGVGGMVAFGFAPGNLDIDPGQYEGEIEITFGDNTTQTVYQLQRFVVRGQF